MYAGFWRRLAALMLDLMVVLVPMSVTGIVVALITGPKSTATMTADLSTFAALWLYFAGMESSRKQATLGKIAFGVRVVDLNGERISFPRATARLLAKILSVLSLFVGFLMAGVTRRKQALHDIVAGSLVVNSEGDPSALERSLPRRPPSAGGIVAIALSVVCLPLAAAAAAIAFPAYQDYRVRTKVNDVVLSVRSATAGVAAYMARHKTAPRSLEEVHPVPSSPHLRNALITREGAIVLTLDVEKLEGNGSSSCRRAAPPSGSRGRARARISRSVICRGNAGGRVGGDRSGEHRVTHRRSVGFAHPTTWRVPCAHARTRRSPA